MDIEELKDLVKRLEKRIARGDDFPFFCQSSGAKVRWAATCVEDFLNGIDHKNFCKLCTKPISTEYLLKYFKFCCLNTIRNNTKKTIVIKEIEADSGDNKYKDIMFKNTNISQGELKDVIMVGELQPNTRFKEVKDYQPDCYEMEFLRQLAEVGRKTNLSSERMNLVGDLDSKGISEQFNRYIFLSGLQGGCCSYDCMELYNQKKHKSVI